MPERNYDLDEAVDRAFEQFIPDLVKAIGPPMAFYLRRNADTSFGYEIVRVDEVVIAHFSLRQLPHCSAMTMAIDLEVAPEYRGRGIGTVIHRLRMAASRSAGYRGMIGTVRTDNEANRHILSKLGWAETGLQIPSRHGGFVTTWEVIL